MSDVVVLVRNEYALLQLENDATFLENTKNMSSMIHVLVWCFWEDNDIV